MCIKNSLAQILNWQGVNSVLKCTAYLSIKLIRHENIRAKLKLIVEPLTQCYPNRNRSIRSVLFWKYLTSDWNINGCKLTPLAPPIHIHGGRSDVDGVCMFLAQSLVFFGEERLTFQRSRADLWREPKIYSAVLLFTQHSQHCLIFRSNPCCCCGWNYLLDLPHTQSRCHARWIREPPGTCPLPRWGSHSRGSWSQTDCSSLSEERQNVILFARIVFFTTPTLLLWASCSTLFTVWLSILHVKHVASDWLLAGDTDETGHMPGLFQGIHDLLQRKRKK